MRLSFGNSIDNISRFRRELCTVGEIDCAVNEAESSERYEINIFASGFIKYVVVCICGGGSSISSYLYASNLNTVT